MNSKKVLAILGSPRADGVTATMLVFLNTHSRVQTPSASSTKGYLLFVQIDFAHDNLNRYCEK